MSRTEHIIALSYTRSSQCIIHFYVLHAVIDLFFTLPPNCLSWQKLLVCSAFLLYFAPGIHVDGGSIFVSRIPEQNNDWKFKALQKESEFLILSISCLISLEWHKSQELPLQYPVYCISKFTPLVFHSQTQLLFVAGFCVSHLIITNLCIYSRKY